MQDFSTMEMLAGAAVVLLVLFIGRRSIPAMLKESEEAPKDWAGLVFPLVFVIALVVVVITFLRA